jgi:hypothetical protein
MNFFAKRVEALQKKRFAIEQTFTESVYLEKVGTSGTSPFFPTTGSVEWSIALDPPPIVKVVGEEDIEGAGSTNVSIGDYIFETLGSLVTAEQIKTANRIFIGTIDEAGVYTGRYLKVLYYRAGDWPNISGKPLAMMGKVQFWHIYVRGQIQA